MAVCCNSLFSMNYVVRGTIYHSIMRYIQEAVFIHEIDILLKRVHSGQGILKIYPQLLTGLARNNPNLIKNQTNSSSQS